MGKLKTTETNFEKLLQSKSMSNNRMQYFNMAMYEIQTELWDTVNKLANSCEYIYLFYLTYANTQSIKKRFNKQQK